MVFHLELKNKASKILFGLILITWIGSLGFFLEMGGHVSVLKVRLGKSPRKFVFLCQ